MITAVIMTAVSPYTLQYCGRWGKLPGDGPEPGTVLFSEQWDDSLPSTMLFEGRRRRREEYEEVQLTWHTGTEELDNEQKLERNLSQLAQAEYVTILSNRVYGVDPRLPERYPISGQYHPLLFDGALGYELVYVAGRSPHFFDLQLLPDTFGWPGLRPPQAVADYLYTPHTSALIVPTRALWCMTSR